MKQWSSISFSPQSQGSQTSSKQKQKNSEGPKQKKDKKRYYYQVYKTWESSPGSGSIPGSSSQQYYITTEDLNLAKEVFTFKIFGYRTQDLPQKYLKIREKLFLKFDEDGIAHYQGNEDLYGVGNQDEVLLVLQRNQFQNTFKFQHSHRFLRQEQQNSDTQYEN